MEVAVTAHHGCKIGFEWERLARHGEVGVNSMKAWSL